MQYLDVLLASVGHLLPRLHSARYVLLYGGMYGSEKPSTVG